MPHHFIICLNRFYANGSWTCGIMYVTHIIIIINVFIQTRMGSSATVIISLSVLVLASCVYNMTMGHPGGYGNGVVTAEALINRNMLPSKRLNILPYMILSKLLKPSFVNDSYRRNMQSLGTKNRWRRRNDELTTNEKCVWLNIRGIQNLSDYCHSSTCKQNILCFWQWLGNNSNDRLISLLRLLTKLFRLYFYFMNSKLINVLRKYGENKSIVVMLNCNWLWLIIIK